MQGCTILQMTDLTESSTPTVKLHIFVIQDNSEIRLIKYVPIEI